MANDVLFGWVLGMITIAGPLVGLKYREMRNQIAFLRGNGEKEAVEPSG